MLIRKVDLNKSPKETCKILLAQPKWDSSDWQIVDGLYFHTNEYKVRQFVERILESAKAYSVSLVLFPELSIPESLINIINAWSNQNDCIVVAGSHYNKTSSGYIARSPIIFENKIYYTDKIVPAPTEVSPYVHEALIEGETILIFNNTYIGEFALLICSDYLAKEPKQNVLQNKLDFLLVIAFQKDSDIYHNRMAIDCDNSEDGLYIAYVNNTMNDFGDGRSAFFGLMHNTFREKLLNKSTNGNPKNKILEFKPSEEYAVLEVNIRMKQPVLGKKAETRPNINILSKLDIIQKKTP